MAIIMKQCEICGKTYPAVKSNQKYCGSICRLTSVERRNEEIRRKKLERCLKGQLCWGCRRATGMCPWSRSLKPVKGWEAERVTIKDPAGNMSTYKIKACPLYISDYADKL